MREWKAPEVQELEVSLTAYGTTPTDREYKHYAHTGEIVEWEYVKNKS